MKSKKLLVFILLTSVALVGVRQCPPQPPGIATQAIIFQPDEDAVLTGELVWVKAKAVDVSGKIANPHTVQEMQRFGLHRHRGV